MHGPLPFATSFDQVRLGVHLGSGVIMEVSQGHNSVPTQPIEFKLGRIDVFVEFYRSRHKTNFRTNSMQVRFVRLILRNFMKIKPLTNRNGSQINGMDTFCTCLFLSYFSFVLNKDGCTESFPVFAIFSIFRDFSGKRMPQTYC